MSPSQTPPADRRPVDVICLGRLAVDLYAQQLGARLEDATSMAKYLGGSSANIAFGCARLGLRAAMASRVGDDHMGRFLKETLAAEGCDVSHVSVDPDRLSALVLLGIRDRETFPLVFYRQNCADMAVRDEDVEEPFIASSRAFLVTGTHLSTEHVHQVSSLALQRARRHRVTAHLQEMLPRFDLVVGTEEEFRIAGGREDLVQSLRAVRALTPAALVVKLGPRGCAVFEGDVPARMEEEHVVPGFPVKVMNVLGAGDAFMAGLLKGWLTGASWREAARMANACGALVVARHACSASMPTPDELEYFMARPGLDRPDQDAHLARLHRVSGKRKRWDDLAVLAFDHRAQFKDLAREAGAPEERIPELKKLLVRAAAETEEALRLQGHVGALIDDTYGEDALFAASGRGWWLGRPVEVPGSRPIEFEGGRSIGSRLASWPREQVVKCLVRYHPDEPADLRMEQETQLRALYDAVQLSGHELLLEVIPPTDVPCDDRTIARALDRIYQAGIYPEWWKLAPMSRETWNQVDDLLARRDPWCRGVLVLGLNAPIQELAAGFREAAASRNCRGFAVGRTIWHGPSRDWLAGRIGDAELVSRARASFEALIREWRAARSGRKEATA